MKIMIIKNKKMTSKLNKKASLAVITSIIMVSGFSMITYNNYIADATVQTTIDEIASKYSPVDQPRTGVPFLMAYPLAVQPDRYHHLNLSDSNWIGRLVEKGETNITENEVKDFFAIMSDNNSIFGVTVGDTIKYYQIDYVEIPLSLSEPYIKAYRLETSPIKSISVDMHSNSWLKKAIDNEFRWIQSDVPSAMALKQLSNNENFNFEITLDDGSKEFYNIRYSGPELSTMEIP
jgi:hypothetical protein